MANTGGFRLVRCPKCLNILPEPPNVTVYKCGGCGTTLRAKIRASNGQHVAAKQVLQDSDSYSVATAVSNGVPPQNKDQVSIGAVTGSFNADAPSTEHDSNGTRSSENGDDVLAGQNAVAAKDTGNTDDPNFEGQDTSSRMEDPADQTRLNANGTYLDSDETENHTVEQPAENSETCRVSGHDDDTECHLNASENKMLSSEMCKAAVSMQDPEQKEEGEAEHAANKKSYLVRALSRSCDLPSTINSIEFHSTRTSLQSKSFRASEPLQSKIMNTVDELKGDLSELFNKPADCKPKAHPPPRRPSKQDGLHMTQAATSAITSSAPLAAYHPAAKHSGYVSRPSRSGQVAVAAPRGLPSLRYRRHRVYPFHHSVATEMRPCCRHECCHSCQPPCYRSCKQEPAAMMHHKPPTMVIKKRRPPPRNHCLPVLRGAPFVVCSSCVSLVQLPTDFAVPRRGTRRLQCGCCSEVLSYSYRDPARKKLLQSPFGGDEYNSTDEYEIRHQQAAAAGGFEHEHEQADPVSYSEEYGLSFGVSHSTSTEDGQPLYVSRNSSFNTVDERMGRDGKLHRLMGYSSASELLLRHSPDLFESFDRRTPPSARTHVDRKGKGVCVAEDDDDAKGGGERDGAVKRSKARSGGLPLHGILKKGIHGLESLKRRS